MTGKGTFFREQNPDNLMVTSLTRTIRKAFFLTFVTSVVVLCPAFVFASSKSINVQTIRPVKTSGLQTFFKALHYSWTKLEDGVPPLIIESIPTDIENVQSPIKKRTFFMGLLPMILLANREIINERKEILEILERHELRAPLANDQVRLKEISRRYGLRGRFINDHRARRQLMQRVDIIPPSLVLAQAANESAWGTSRFARMGNNLFGEWTFKPGTGIVPEGRPPGETYEVRKFTSLYESIRSYLNNLNRNAAYRGLRRVRADLRKEGLPVTGMALAQGLLKYSERGEDYISEIQAMIRHNKLSRTELASLRQLKSEGLTNIRTSGSGFFSTRNRLIGHLSLTRTNPQLTEPVP